MKRCRNPECGLENPDGVKACKVCGSNDLVPIEQPIRVGAPSVPLAQADTLRTTDSTTIFLGALPALNKSAAGNREGHTDDNQSSAPSLSSNTTRYELHTQALNVNPAQSHPLAWLRAQFGEHRNRTITIIGFGATIIGFFISIVAFPQVNSRVSEYINNAPTIKIITPSPPAVQLGKDVLLTAIAEDKDSDQLSYNWAYSAGKIIGSGVQVTLSTSGIDAQAAPSVIMVTLTVSDQRGGQSQLTQPIRVLNDKPVIKSIVPVKSQLQAGEDVKLIALAEDPNGKNQTLSFKWSCSEGQINQDGSSIATLETAKIKVRLDPITIMVYVTVTNEIGGLASGYVPLSILPQQGTILRGRKRIRTSFKLKVGPVKSVNPQEVNSAASPSQASPSNSTPATQTQQRQEKSNTTPPPSEPAPGMPP